MCNLLDNPGGQERQDDNHSGEGHPPPALVSLEGFFRCHGKNVVTIIGRTLITP
jgi:hypothetical protein